MGPFGWGVVKQALILGQWALTGTGPGNDVGLAALSFLKTDESLDVPDIQMHFIGALLKDHGKTKPDKHCFSNHVCMLRPESRGYIALKSLNPTDQPLIQPNYLSTQKQQLNSTQLNSIFPDSGLTFDSVFRFFYFSSQVSVFKILDLFSQVSL